MFKFWEEFDCDKCNAKGKCMQFQNNWVNPVRYFNICVACLKKLKKQLEILFD